MKKLLLLIFLITFLSGCDDEKTPVEFFSVTLDPSYPVGNDLWIILHDQDGAVIDSKSIETGQTITFESTSAPEQFSVTLLKYLEENNFTLSTYHGESKGSEWTLGSAIPLSNSGTSLGSLTVRISDPELGHPFYGQVSAGTGFQFFQSESNTFFQQTISSVQSDRKYFISAVDKSGKPYHKFLETPVTGQVNYTLADLIPFSNEMTLTLGPTTSDFYAAVYSYEAGQRPDQFVVGYLTNLRYLIGSPIPSTLRLGLTNRFANHYVFATAETSPGNRSNYEAFGPTFPTELNINANVTVSVTEKNRNNFTLSSEDYDWYSATYTSTISVTGGGEIFRSWTIRGDDTSFKNLVSLPEELTQLYPEIDFDDFTWASTNIYKGGRSYQDFLSSQFKGDHLVPFVERYRLYY